MTLSDAILIRSSHRTYLPAPISPAQRKQLWKSIKQINHRSGLRIQLVCGRPEPFLPYSHIKGARHYLVLAGPAEDPDLEEKCGYYGEELILTAAGMGLGTCWVGGTYDRQSCRCHLEDGEALVCIVAVGHINDGAAAEHRPASELAASMEGTPDWFVSGIAAVRRAPSAMNRQGYRFSYLPDGTVRAGLTVTGEFSMVDLGIAKLHFELGAHGGAWTWGDGGVFRKAAEEKSCGAVIWREQEGRQYLLARHNGGHWSFPKGHMEQGETEVQTAAREILEETGLRAEIDDGFRQQVTYYPKPGIIKDVIFFTARPLGGLEHAQEAEIAELGWFSFQEARSLITYATDEEVLLAAEAYLEERSGGE